MWPDAPPSDSFAFALVARWAVIRYASFYGQKQV